MKAELLLKQTRYYSSKAKAMIDMADFMSHKNVAMANRQPRPANFDVKARLTEVDHPVWDEKSQAYRMELTLMAEGPSEKAILTWQDECLKMHCIPPHNAMKTASQELAEVRKKLGVKTKAAIRSIR